MKWALIATVEQLLMVYSDEQGWHHITVQPGTILNIVVYEQGMEWTPPDGTRLAQVPATANIGDTGYND